MLRIYTKVFSWTEIGLNKIQKDNYGYVAGELGGWLPNSQSIQIGRAIFVGRCIINHTGRGVDWQQIWQRMQSITSQCPWKAQALFLCKLLLNGKQTGPSLPPSFYRLPYITLLWKSHPSSWRDFPCWITLLIKLKPSGVAPSPRKWWKSPVFMYPHGTKGPKPLAK